MIELADIAYGWLRTGHPRGLFTLWHEIAHARLHTRELLDGEYIEHALHALSRDGTSHELFRDSEWQADTFAAAALAPLWLLRLMKKAGRLSPEELSEVTGLSRESAAYRIDNATRKQSL